MYRTSKIANTLCDLLLNIFNESRPKPHVYYYSLIPIFRGFCPQGDFVHRGFCLQVLFKGFCPRGAGGGGGCGYHFEYAVKSGTLE